MKTLLSIAFLFITILSQAQGWQWANRGGASGNSTSPARPDNIVDMDTDPNGNVYILSAINSLTPVTIGNTNVSTYGGMDILVASYNCQGALRWKKVIGSSDYDLPSALRTDTLGHVFVTGSFGYPDIHFGADTSFNSFNGKTIFLVQYDTLGNLKWFSQPAPDTASLTTNYTAFSVYDLFASKNGDVTLLSYLSPGLLSGGGNYVVTTAGVYFLNYNATGAITSVIPVQMSVTENSTGAGPAANFYNIKMKKSSTTKYQIAGTVNRLSGLTHLSLGGQLINHPMFIGCFNSNGQFLWKKEGAGLSEGIFYRGIADKNGNIVYAAAGQHNSTLGNFTFINPLNSASTANLGLPSFVIIDTSGNVVKGKCAAIVSPGAGVDGISISNNKVYCSGSYLSVKWDSMWFANPQNGGSDIFMVGFDTATLALVSADSLKSSIGYYENVSAMVSDNKGNLYLGGNFEGNLTVNGTTLNSAGGKSDFFIAKYGTANCGTVVPLKLLTFTAKWLASSPSAAEGLGAALLQWATAQEVNTSHFEIERSTDGRNFSKIGIVSSDLLAGNTHKYAYTDNNPYASPLSNTVGEGPGVRFYRLKMVDKDGLFEYSPIRKLTINLSPAGITIYPNPAKDVIQIAGSNMVQLTITDQTGRNLFTRQCAASGLEKVSVAGFAKAVYVLRVRDARGSVRVGKVVVE